MRAKLAAAIRAWNYPPHRGLVAWCVILLPCAAYAGYAVAQEEARAAADCRASPGMFCGFGAALEASLGRAALGPLLVSALACGWLAFWSWRRPEVTRASLVTWLAILHLAPAAIAWALDQVWSARALACIEARDTCFQSYHERVEWVAGAPGVLAVVGAIALVLVLVSRRRAQDTSPPPF